MAAGRIWVAGHTGMVGSAITGLLEERGERVIKIGRADLDLRNQSAVAAWLAHSRPDAIILAAARVGGIHANDTYPAEFIYDNLAIATNVIHAAHGADVQRLVFLGSSCVYPKMAPQPISASALLMGPLEPTNEWYAVAKIAGIKLCQAYMKQYGRAYVSIMPCNLYGPGDNFVPMTSHVIPALLHRFHTAKMRAEPSVVVWGTGTPLREFLYVEDLARGILCCLDGYGGLEPINCGAGNEISINGLAQLVGRIIGYTGLIEFDVTKPDGTPRKLLDSSEISALGWSPGVPLVEGLGRTYQWFLQHADQFK